MMRARSDSGAPTTNWTTPARVCVTEDEPRRFHPFARYTVHAIIDGQEQTMGCWGRTAADRVAEQTRKTPIYPKFSLRSVYSSIYHE